MSGYCQYLRALGAAAVCLAALLPAACDATEPAVRVPVAPVSTPTPRAPATPAKPSFDCAKAATPLEKEICRDPELARWEREMAEPLREVLAVASEELRPAVLDGQRSFLAYAETLCRRGDGYAPDCLVQAYYERGAVLSVKPDSFGRTFVDVASYRALPYAPGPKPDGYEQPAREVRLSQIARPANATARRWNAAAAELLAGLQADVGFDAGFKGQSTFWLFPVATGPDFISSVVRFEDRSGRTVDRSFDWVLSRGRELEPTDLFADPDAAFDALARLAVRRAKIDGGDAEVDADVSFKAARAAVADFDAWVFSEEGFLTVPIGRDRPGGAWALLPWADVKPLLRKDAAFDPAQLRSTL